MSMYLHLESLEHIFLEPVSLSMQPSVHQDIHFSQEYISSFVSQSIHSSMYSLIRASTVHPSISLSTHLSPPPIHPSINLFTCSSTMSIYRPILPPSYRSIHRPIHPFNTSIHSIISLSTHVFIPLSPQPFTVSSHRPDL